jgi:hypothetical protein
MDVGCSGAGWRALDIFLRRRAETSQAIAARYAAAVELMFFGESSNQARWIGGGCAAGGFGGRHRGRVGCSGVRGRRSDSTGKKLAVSNGTAQCTTRKILFAYEKKELNQKQQATRVA